METWYVKKREAEVKNRLKGYKVLMSGAIKGAGRNGRPRGGIVLAFKTRLIEETKEEEDFIQEQLIENRVMIKGKDWKIALTYMRRRRGEILEKIREMEWMGSGRKCIDRW